MKYLIKDIAKLLSVTTNTIRRYENSGFLNPQRDTSNYRWYEDFDINKASIIRLYIKCGFTHSEISQMLDNENSNIHQIFRGKLENIDKQIERLYRLRHWLKDNIQLMETITELNHSFCIKYCPPLKYITYRAGENICNDKSKLEVIKQFMYDAPEVQLIQVFKYNDFIKGNFISHGGWAVKEVDIEKFQMQNIINDENIFIETYPKQKCLYGVIEIPADMIYNTEEGDRIRIDYLKKATNYAVENGYNIIGDMMEFIVNALGNTVSILVCLPIEQINK